MSNNGFDSVVINHDGVDDFFDMLFAAPRTVVKTDKYSFIVDGDGSLRIYGFRRNKEAEIIYALHEAMLVAYPNCRVWFRNKSKQIAYSRDSSTKMVQLTFKKAIELLNLINQ